MARIRTIKPDAFLSESLSSVPRGTRWTFAGLWTYVDDEGRGRDDARLIRAALYPLDDDMSTADVEHDLELLAGIGAIIRYEVDGRRYLCIPAWSDHQSAAYRRSESKLPAPPSTTSAHNGVQTAHKSVLEVEGKGREEEVEQGRGKPRADARTPDKLPEPFLEFCAAYPGTVQTKPAFAAWPAAIRRAGGYRAIVHGAIAYAGWVKDTGTEAKFIRNAVKWLNEDGWLDTHKTPQRASPRSTTDERVTDAFQLANELRAQETPTPKAIGR